MNQLEAMEGPVVDEIMPAVYDEIRRLAQVQLSRERQGHTLSATALANEAYLRLVDQTKVRWENKRHFMAVAATAIRRILIDHARARNREKRGGGQNVLSLDTSILVETDQFVDLLELDEALQRLESLEPDKARVVVLRFYGDMTEQDIAGLIGVTERTVRRYWQYARAWLYRELQEE